METITGVTVNVQDTDMEVVVACDGSSIWGDTTGREVTVTGIAVDECGIKVTHNSGWDIYTDAGFEKGISGILGYQVLFTEQGMQQNGIASLEV